jgi:hypothetical protein
MTEKPIVEIRAVNYTWVEYNPKAPNEVIEKHSHRIEIRREGETEWVEIPVIQRMATPT